ATASNKTVPAGPQKYPLNRIGPADQNRFNLQMKSALKDQSEGHLRQADREYLEALIFMPNTEESRKLLSDYMENIQRHQIGSNEGGGRATDSNQERHEHD
ncbi:MAG: hypothetical protein ACREBJ_07885, partial [Nitrosotalea sp.]